MDNIIDYIEWVGRFTFDELPFSEVDALVFSQASYYDLRLYENYPDLPLSLHDLYDRIAVERHVNVNISNSMASARTARFIRAMAKSRRFGEMKVIDFVERLDHENAVQFSAVTFERKDDFSFIAFRGTDDTLAGWKEDFMICFMRTTAQEMALQYASDHIRDGVKNYIGGHSKGANMTLFAACMMDFEKWVKVERVFLLDGPGLCGEVTDTTDMARVNRRATQIVPCFSVVGKLFEPTISRTYIVDSSAEGLMQHDLLSWGVDHGKLLRVKENDPQSVNLSEIINGWVADISAEERKVFVNELFGYLEKAGCKTLGDFQKLGMDGLGDILENMLGSSKTTKKTIASLPNHALFGNIFSGIRKIGFFHWVKQSTLAKSLALILSGVFFILASRNLLDISSKIFFAVLALAEVALTVRKLVKNGWKFGNIRYRIYACITLIILCVVVILRDSAMYILGSLLFGIIALGITFRSFDAAITQKDGVWQKIIHLYEAVSSAVYGISFLVIDPLNVFKYMVGIGIVMIADGVFRLAVAYLPLFQKTSAEKSKKYY